MVYVHQATATFRRETCLIWEYVAKEIEAWDKVTYIYSEVKVNCLVLSAEGKKTKKKKKGINLAW